MLHIQHDESDNGIDKVRNSDDDFRDEELQNEAINEFLSQDLSVLQQLIKSSWTLYGF